MPPQIKRNSARRLPRTYEELVRELPPRAIHDDVSCESAQEMIDALTSIPKRTKDQEAYLDTLSTLMEAYENQTEDWDDKGGPIDVLRHLMEEHGMNASALGTLLGERSLGSKILGGERSLSKAHIRTLSRHFGVPADLFL